MASLGKDLALQPGDQIAVVREGPAGVFREGYAVILSDDNQGISAADASVEVTGPTGPNNNYAVSVKVDPAAGNLITVTPDGVRVDAPAADDNQVISANDASVVVSGPTGINNNYGVAVQIDPAAGNGIALTPTGLRVELANDASTPLADIAALTDASRGLSLGEVKIPTNRALTVAEMMQTWTDKVSLAFRYLTTILTNGAAEAAADGVRNPDGKLGYASWPQGFFVAGAINVINSNGGLHRVLNATSGQIFQVANGTQNGNRFSLFFSPSAATPDGCEVLLYAPAPNTFSGVFRNRQHKIKLHNTAVAEYIPFREGEWLDFVYQSGSWRVASRNLTMYAEAEWLETDQGFAEITKVSAASGSQVLPVALLNTNYAVTTSNGAVVSAKTPTGFTVSAACDWHLTGGEIDYAALGGVANF
jgi:hypothetical protein